MSIKGFKFGDGEVQKYDYEALDNLPESFVEIDDTLTEEGKAADAKKTGDEIADLKSTINNIVDSSSLSALFYALPTSNSDYYDNKVRSYGETAIRLINDKTISFPFGIKITCQSGYGVWVYELNDAYVFTGNTNATALATSGEMSAGDSYTCTKSANILIKIKKSGGENVSSSDWGNAFAVSMIVDDLTKLTGKVQGKADKSALDAIVDTSPLFEDFSETPTYNATYTSGKIADWGTAAKRVINTKTLSFPVDVKYVAHGTYLFYAYTFSEPHTFTGNGSVANTGGSGAWVSEYIAKAGSNILLIAKNDNGSNITTSEWFNAISVEVYPTDLTICANKLNALLMSATEYYTKGKPINVTKQHYTVTKLSYSPIDGTGRTVNGIAIYNGVIFQMFSNGDVSLIDMATGNIITSYTLNAGHGGSASFSNEFYDPQDEFPLFYVASFNEPKTFVYRISRSEFALVKTYVTPIETSGYRQESCIDREDGTLWVVGYEVDSKTDGGAIIVSQWNLDSTTDNGDGTYTPDEISVFKMQFIPYLQCVQYMNGCLFLLTGSDVDNTPEQLTRIHVLNVGVRAISSVMDMFPANLLNAEPEGLDFVENPNGYKYDMIISARMSSGFFRVEL